MNFLSLEKIALNILSFFQDVGSWVCIGAGIILIIFGIVFATRRVITVTPVGVASRLAGRNRSPSAVRSVMCFAVGGVLAFGGWAFVKDLSRHAYYQVLALVIEDDPNYIDKIENIDDIFVNEPTADEVLAAFEKSGGILADGFKKSLEKIPDILVSINKILIRAGLSPVDETIVENAIDSLQANSEVPDTQRRE